jgi:uncharacterized protein YkwD
MKGRLGGLGAALAAMAAVGCGGGTDEAGASVSTRPAKAEVHALSLPAHDAGGYAFETELLGLVNAHRVSLGLEALVDADAIRDVARAHSRHMVDHRFVAHVSPEGLLPGERLSGAGVAWTEAGENVAAAFATPPEVFEAWLSSPLHRENIESERWTHAGAGYAADAGPTEEHPFTHYWTLNFVRP